MNVLIACEESQRVCAAFRARGHRAFSCDIVDCSGGHPEWHIKADVLPLLDGNCSFTTADTHTHTQSGEWDLIIAHPPCTYLTATGNRWFNIERYGEKAIQRHKDREQAAAFFMRFINANCKRIAVENPIGFMSTRYKKPSQVIQPWMFGDSASKATCLWLKGLPELKPTKIVSKGKFVEFKSGKRMAKWYCDAWTKSKTIEERKNIRSKTFQGIADAMAEQWGTEHDEQMSLW